MTGIVLKNRQDKPIKDWKVDWTRPKRNYHWKEGRSAIELARSWFTTSTPQCPSELSDLLSTSHHTASIQFSAGCPEHVTKLPERGEGRNHDLMLMGYTSSETAIICIEAKVDEAFGEYIGEKWQKARASQKPTRVPERIQSLLEIVFGANAQPDQLPWRDLRYHLLTGIAGTLLQADCDKAPLGVFVVHEFHTESAKPEKLKVNAEDYANFVRVLFSASVVSEGQMYGQLTIQPNRYLDRAVELFVGKAVCNRNV